MVANFETALIITLLGMGLVFSAILVLWLAITVLVAISSRITKNNEIDSRAASTADLKRCAAAAAVVVALARQSEMGLHEFPLPPTAIVSAWQAVMRSNIIKKRGQVR